MCPSLPLSVLCWVCRSLKKTEGFYVFLLHPLAPLIQNLQGRAFDSPPVSADVCLVVLLTPRAWSWFFSKLSCSVFLCSFAAWREAAVGLDLVSSPPGVCMCVWLHRGIVLEIPLSLVLYFYILCVSQALKTTLSERWIPDGCCEPSPCLCSKLSLSHTETSEDEEEDESDSDDDDGDEDDDDGGCEENGLGLLARFAASALPVSPPPLSLLHDGKHCSSRQSMLGNPKRTQIIWVLTRISSRSSFLIGWFLSNLLYR